MRTAHQHWETDAEGVRTIVRTWVDEGPSSPVLKGGASSLDAYRGDVTVSLDTMKREELTEPE